MTTTTYITQEADTSLAVDLSQYLSKPDTPPPAMIDPAQVTQAEARMMAGVGVRLKGAPRSGTYVQRDFYPLCLLAWSKDIELLPIAEALKRYDWLAKTYAWKAVPADLDPYTAQCAAAAEPQGFFIRVKQGVKIPFPVQTCLYMSRGDIVQMVHNIVILEEEAELQLVAGCTVHPGVYAGAHLGITESYLGQQAKLTSTMVHRWSPGTVVRPRSGTVVEAGGVYTENYCTLQPGASIQANPRTWLNGREASVKYLTIILGSEGSTIDLGGEIYLNGEDSSAELAHRAVCTGGLVYQRGLLIGNASCRAHVDCAGMVLSSGKGGFIQSIPGLKAFHPEARMSHEASIGKIAPEQVEYLQTRGMDEREAISLIIRGFLGADIAGLGSELDARIAEIAEMAGHGEKKGAG
jgi:Fe-S cluster assembly scaffold protein SufB